MTVGWTDLIYIYNLLVMFFWVGGNKLCCVGKHIAAKIESLAAGVVGIFWPLEVFWSSTFKYFCCCCFYYIPPIRSCLWTYGCGFREEWKFGNGGRSVVFMAREGSLKPCLWYIGENLRLCFLFCLAVGQSVQSISWPQLYITYVFADCKVCIIFSTNYTCWICITKYYVP